MKRLGRLLGQNTAVKPTVKCIPFELWSIVRRTSFAGFIYRCTYIALDSKTELLISIT